MNLEKTKKYIIIFFLVAFVIYGFFESFRLISGPKIEVFSPTDGQYFEEALIDVKGVTKNISSISLDDRPIFIDKEGYFEEKLILSPGYNIMIIKGQDKFGKNIEEKFQLFLKKSEIDIVPEIITSTSSLEIASTTATSTKKINSNQIEI